MTCPACFDTDKIEVEMTHENATSHVFDPGEPTGHGEISGCVATCPKCGWTCECDEDHNEKFHEEI